MSEPSDEEQAVTAAQAERDRHEALYRENPSILTVSALVEAENRLAVAESPLEAHRRVRKGTDGRYYVGAADRPDQMYYMAGPYETREAAQADVDAVFALGCQKYPGAAQWQWGTFLYEPEPDPGTVSWPVGDLNDALRAQKASGT